MKSIFNASKKHLVALAAFIVLTLVYFAPSVFQGKELPMGDIQKWQGMSKELADYAKTDQAEDFPVLSWTGSMFSGMPSYTVTNQKVPANFLSYLEAPFKWTGTDAGAVLIGLVCFYILMCVLGANTWIAVAGAIAFAFASYNIIILEAGHVTKAYAIAYMPLTLAGMVLVFREKWLWGSIATLLGVTLSLKSSHIQITYYLALLCVIVFIGYAVGRLRQKDFATLGKATGVLAACVVLAVLPSIGSLYSQYELSKESIRGASELTAATTGDEERPSTGLDIDYAFAWSYGKAETLTMLVPNLYGGSSGGTLDEHSALYQAAKAHGMRTGKTIQTATYWGDQPFTSGPVYFGALVCFLFVLGMFVIPSRMKWWLLGASVFFVLLSWGYNFMAFNEFIFHYLPMYNKFRTVSMALVIPGLVFPLVGIWGLKVIFAQEVDRKRLTRALYWSAGITGGLCLVLWLVPGALFDFRAAADAQYQLPDWYYNALVADRQSLLKKDALRSLVFIVLGAGLIYWYIRQQANGKNTKAATYAGAGLVLLMLCDLWGVDKRFVNYDTFATPKAAQVFKPTAADQFILQDEDPSYRVLNLNNPFNETNTSYYHKSIGGYNAAKLRRYQELIDYRLTGEINQVVNALQQAKTYADLEDMPVFQRTPTLNMLNTRYIIFNPEQPPIVNPQAYGNAWFVPRYEIVENADEEMAALQRIDPRTTAVVARQQAGQVEGKSFVRDSTARITLTSYEPVRMRYRSQSATEQLAVFSEVYYPHGWEATIDGQPAEHFRADWTLRAMLVPPGEHDIEFRFMPRTYIACSRVASASSLLILLLLVGAVARQAIIAMREGRG